MKSYTWVLKVTFILLLLICGGLIFLLSRGVILDNNMDKIETEIIHIEKKILDSEESSELKLYMKEIIDTKGELYQLRKNDYYKIIQISGYLLFSVLGVSVVGLYLNMKKIIALKLNDYIGSNTRQLVDYIELSECVNEIKRKTSVKVFSEMISDSYQIKNTLYNYNFPNENVSCFDYSEIKDIAYKKNDKYLLILINDTFISNNEQEYKDNNVKFEDYSKQLTELYGDNKNAMFFYFGKGNIRSLDRYNTGYSKNLSTLETNINDLLKTNINKRR